MNIIELTIEEVAASKWFAVFKREYPQLEMDQVMPLAEGILEALDHLYGGLPLDLGFEKIKDDVISLEFDYEYDPDPDSNIDTPENRKLVEFFLSYMLAGVLVDREQEKHKSK